MEGLLASRETGTIDIEQFKRIKKIRDRLAHRGEILDASLPAADLRGLFEKYLRNHVRRFA